MKKLIFILLLIALIGCKTKQTIEQEKEQTTSSIQKAPWLMIAVLSPSFMIC